MELVWSHPHKLRAMHDQAGKFKLFFGGMLIPGHTLATIGPDATGAHYLTIQFPLPCVSLGELPAPPVLAAVT